MSLVPQVSPALRDLLALLDPQVRVLRVCLDLKDLLEPREPLAAPSLANLDPQVDLANLVPMEHLVRRETLVLQALRDLEDLLDLLEALDLLASQLLASLDLLVFLGQWDLEESPVTKDIQVFLDCQVLRVIEGWELLDLRVRQGLLDLWVPLEPQVRLELESQEDQVVQVSQESQVAQVGMVPLVPWDHRDPRDTLVPLV